MNPQTSAAPAPGFILSISTHWPICAGLRQCRGEAWGATFDDCLPNWLNANQSIITSPYGYDAMLCPGLTFWRPNQTYPVLLRVSHFIELQCFLHGLPAVQYPCIIPLQSPSSIQGLHVAIGTAGANRTPLSFPAGNLLKHF